MKIYYLLFTIYFTIICYSSEDLSLDYPDGIYYSNKKGNELKALKKGDVWSYDILRNSRKGHEFRVQIVFNTKDKPTHPLFIIDKQVFFIGKQTLGSEVQYMVEFGSVEESLKFQKLLFGIMIQ